MNPLVTWMPLDNATYGIFDLVSELFLSRTANFSILPEYVLNSLNKAVFHTVSGATTTINLNDLRTALPMSPAEFKEVNLGRYAFYIDKRPGFLYIGVVEIADREGKKLIVNVNRDVWHPTLSARIGKRLTLNRNVIYLV